MFRVIFHRTQGGSPVQGVGSLCKRQYKLDKNRIDPGNQGQLYLFCGLYGFKQRRECNKSPGGSEKKYDQFTVPRLLQGDQCCIISEDEKWGEGAQGLRCTVYGKALKSYSLYLIYYTFRSIPDEENIIIWVLVSGFGFQVSE